MKNNIIYTVETDDKILCFYKANKGNSAVNPGGFINKDEVETLHVSYFDSKLKAENARSKIINKINFLLSDDCQWFDSDESKYHNSCELERLKMYKEIQKKPSMVQVVCRILKIE